MTCKTPACQTPVKSTLYIVIYDSDVPPTRWSQFALLKYWVYEEHLIDQDADVAQLVEQRIRNAWVAGSIPVIGSNTIIKKL